MDSSEDPKETEIIEVKKEKKQRTPAQMEALMKAREKAMHVRAENAAERAKIKEIEAHERNQKQELRRKKIEEEYHKISKPDKEEDEEEEEIQYVKRPKKKKIIRVVESSSEDEVEFQLPKRRQLPIEKTQEEIDREKRADLFERTRLKLFTVSNV